MSERDAKYRKFVVKQPCLCQPCASKPEFHHMTGAPNYAPGERKPKQRVGLRGQSQKAADYYGIPLCHHHHGQRHRLKGWFDGWTRSGLRGWEGGQVERLRAKYERRSRKGERVTETSARALLVPLDQEVAEFARELDLSDQREFDLKRLIERARRQGREEGREDARSVSATLLSRRGVAS